MKIKTLLRSECEEAEGLCVVIDVLRAFTTAAYAFAAGAREIRLVSTIDEAFRMHEEDNSLILIGEQDGLPINGFDFGNSPLEIGSALLTGKNLVQRTSAGTQGVVYCRHVDHMILGSFVVAEAIVRYIQSQSPDCVSFIVTGANNGDEDAALAEYLTSKLLLQPTSSLPFLNRVRNSPEGILFAQDGALAQDLDLGSVQQ